MVLCFNHEKQEGKDFYRACNVFRGVTEMYI
jgi:hypothetical protein